MVQQVAYQYQPEYQPEEDDTASDVSSEEELLKAKVSLSGTPYDGIVMALTCINDNHYRTSRGTKAVALLLVCAIVILVVNVLIQFVLVFSLLVTTVHDESIPFKDRVHINAMAKAVDEALSSGNAMEASKSTIEDDAIKHCSELNTLPFTHFIVIFIWFTKMMQEFVDALWRCVYVYGLPVVDRTEQPLIETKDGKMTIVGTTSLIKIIFSVGVALPQFLVATVLTWTGAKYLFFAVDMGKLVMKAISLAFITQVDELMFATFASQRFKEVVKGASYTHTYSENFHMLLWGTSAMKFFGVVGIGIVFWHGLHSDVTALRTSCYTYKHEFPPEGFEGHWSIFWAELFGL